MADVKSASDLYRMGCNYYAIRNYRKAQEYLIHAVIRGSSQAARRLYQLGCLLLQRQAGDDLHCAELCFQTLADRGDAESCLQLGLMCKHGRGGAKTCRRHSDILMKRGSWEIREALMKRAC